MNLPKLLEIKETANKGMGLFATKNIQRNTIIFHFKGKIRDDAHSNDESLQIGKNRFLESILKYDDCLNHSCNPNCFIDFRKLNLVSIRDIRERGTNF